MAHSTQRCRAELWAANGPALLLSLLHEVVGSIANALTNLAPEGMHPAPSGCLSTFVAAGFDRLERQLASHAPNNMHPSWAKLVSMRTGVAGNRAGSSGGLAG